MKTMNQRNYSKQNGITLIALVVTIVVLLILAGVSINALFGNTGIINKAKDAQNKMDQAVQNDLEGLNSLSNWLDSKINGANKPVTNPYETEQWTMAYICNNETWSNTPLTSANGDTIPEGTQIVAKFYTTGEKITPQSIQSDGITVPFSEGEEYKVVIEGTGEMGILMDATSISDIKSANAWQVQTALYLDWLQGGMQGDAVSCITPYITELTICDGITNVGNFAMAGATSLSKVTLGNSLEIIGNFSFSFNNMLNKIVVPNRVTTIGERAFICDDNLEEINIPNSVINIGESTFWKNEEKVTKLIVTSESEAKRINSLNTSPAYARTIVANENSITKSTINAAEVAKHPVVYCGKEVTGYTCDNSAGVNKWKIYHSDGKNIYLIADNYITAEYIPSKDGATMTASSTTNAYYFNDTLLNKYTGAVSITDANITPWLSYLKSSYGGSDNTNNNMKATAYLLDTEIWKGFKNSTKAKYAIGAPTLDMFVASYNTRFAKQIETIVQETGYNLKFTDGDSYEYSLATYDYLTAHQYKDGYAYYMWLASPSANNSDYLMNVNYGGGVDYCIYVGGTLGVRPLVCLESGVSLEKQEVNGDIVYNIK